MKSELVKRHAIANGAIGHAGSPGLSLRQKLPNAHVVHQSAD
jgi:hypothetical protein